MRKERTLFILGIWVATLSFLGFPKSWRDVLFVITGFALMYLSYLFYQEAGRRASKTDNQSKTFIDNIGSRE